MNARDYAPAGGMRALAAGARLDSVYPEPAQRCRAAAGAARASGTQKVFPEIDAEFDLRQTARSCPALHCVTLLLISSHPSGQKGSCGHSMF